MHILSAVYAVARNLTITSWYCRNSWMDQAGFWHRGYLGLYCTVL